MIEPEPGRGSIFVIEPLQEVDFWGIRERIISMGKGLPRRDSARMLGAAYAELLSEGRVVQDLIERALRVDKASGGIDLRRVRKRIEEEYRNRGLQGPVLG